MTFRPKVLVTTCTGDCWIHKHVVMSLIRVLRDGRYQSTLMTPTWTPYEQALNRCAKEMLKGDYNYWLNIDDDNPPTGNPLDVLDHDLDLVGFPTPVYHDKVRGDRPWYFNALSYVEEEHAWKPHEPWTGLQEVDAIGTGAFVVSRRVIAQMKPPWFMRQYDEYGIVERGHDYLFCHKAKKLGFRIWADFNCVCQHFVETDLLSAIQAFNAAHQKPQGVSDG